MKRFNIPKVCEFYGATEGNANIVNIDNVVGAIGFVRFFFVVQRLLDNRSVIGFENYSPSLPNFNYQS